MAPWAAAPDAGVESDTGGNSDGSRDIGQVGAQLFDQGLLAAVPCEEPAVGRGGSKERKKFPGRGENPSFAAKTRLAASELGNPTMT
jgi:hypothetical protein